MLLDVRFPDAVPVKAAVIVPAVKLPEPSRTTIAEAVLVLTAVVIALVTEAHVEPPAAVNAVMTWFVQD